MSGRHHPRSGRDARRREDSSESPPPRVEKTSRTGLQTYWIDGQGIHRAVLQRQICVMLGNEAICKPDKYKGVDGYRITAVRPFTSKQLEDLVEISTEYEKELLQHKKKNNKRNAELPYDQSRTSQRHNPPPDDPSRHFRESNYPPQPYPPLGPSDPYGGTSSPFSQPNTSGYAAPQGSRHSPPLPPSSSGYPASGYPASGYPPGYPTARPSGRDPRDNYPDPSIRSPDVPGMGNPYASYGDSMDIDPGPTMSQRGAQGHPPQGHPPSGYGMDDRHFRGDPYGAYPPMQQPPYGMDPSMPRHIPQGDPPGYGDYDRQGLTGGYASGYKQNPIREEKRPYHDDRRRR